MDITTAELVAIMFATFLVIGTNNLLNALAMISGQRDYSSLDRTIVSWIALLLLIHLNLFWVTNTILEQEDWRFAAFLFVLIGPMMLIFANQILLTNTDSEIQTFSRVHLLAVARRFFSVLCLLMVWALAVEFILGDGAASGGIGDLTVLIVFGALALAKNERALAALTVVAWILILTLFGLQGLEIIE